MYDDFNGASSVKCLEMVAYHTIHWSCDSVIIVSCMHLLPIVLHVCQFMLCMDCESEMKIYYYYYYYRQSAMSLILLNLNFKHTNRYENIY